MFAIAFDLVVKDADEHHPKGATVAYADIRRLLTDHGFEWMVSENGRGHSGVQGRAMVRLHHNCESAVAGPAIAAPVAARRPLL